MPIPRETKHLTKFIPKKTAAWCKLCHKNIKNLESHIKKKHRKLLKS